MCVWCECVSIFLFIINVHWYNKLRLRAHLIIGIHGYIITHTLCHINMEAVLPFWAKGEVVRGFGRGSKQLGIPTGQQLTQ